MEYITFYHWAAWKASVFQCPSCFIPVFKARATKKTYAAFVVVPVVIIYSPSVAKLVLIFLCVWIIYHWDVIYFLYQLAIIYLFQHFWFPAVISLMFRGRKYSSLGRETHFVFDQPLLLGIYCICHSLSPLPHLLFWTIPRGYLWTSISATHFNCLLSPHRSFYHLHFSFF